MKRVVQHSALQLAILYLLLLGGVQGMVGGAERPLGEQHAYVVSNGVAVPQGTFSEPLNVLLSELASRADFQIKLPGKKSDIHSPAALVLLLGRFGKDFKRRAGWWLSRRSSTFFFLFIIIPESCCLSQTESGLGFIKCSAWSPLQGGPL